MNKSIHQVIYPPHFMHRPPQAAFDTLDPDYLRSVERARLAMIEERRQNNLCVECGEPWLDEFGCTNNSDRCLEGMLAAKRREQALGAS